MKMPMVLSARRPGIVSRARLMSPERARDRSRGERRKFGGSRPGHDVEAEAGLVRVPRTYVQCCQLGARLEGKATYRLSSASPSRAARCASTSPTSTCATTSRSRRRAWTRHILCLRLVPVLPPASSCPHLPILAAFLPTCSVQ
eukprot:scaffold3998_cov61-Phaeocystis_antarctica.AAC.13